MKNCMVAIVTPMHSNNAVDYTALTNLIEWHITSGTEAIVVLGTTGESPTLTQEERSNIIKVTVAHANKRIPIIIGTGTYDTRHSIELSKQAEALGADGVLVITPYYNKPTQHGLFLHFKAIHDAINIPIILYNNPGRAGCNLEIDTIAKLSQLHNIIGLKDTHPDLTRIAAIQQLCHNKFWLWSSNDNNCVDYVRAGGDGVISVMANIVPSEMKQLIHYALQKNTVATDQLLQKFIPLIDALSLETNPIPVKYALFLMKKMGLGIRLPLTVLEEQHQKVLEKVLFNLNLISPIAQEIQ